MLMTEIREKNGLAYSVFSYLMPYKNVGVLKIGMQTATNNTKKAVSILNDQLSLFEEPQQLIDREALDQTIDHIRRKYGYTSLLHASSLVQGGMALQRAKLLGGHRSGIQK